MAGALREVPGSDRVPHAGARYRTRCRRGAHHARGRRRLVRKLGARPPVACLWPNRWPATMRKYLACRGRLHGRTHHAGRWRDHTFAGVWRSDGARPHGWRDACRAASSVRTTPAADSALPAVGGALCPRTAPDRVRPAAVRRFRQSQPGPEQRTPPANQRRPRKRRLRCVFRRRHRRQFRVGQAVMKQKCLSDWLPARIEAVRPARRGGFNTTCASPTASAAPVYRRGCCARRPEHFTSPRSRPGEFALLSARRIVGRDQVGRAEAAHDPGPCRRPAVRGQSPARAAATT